MPIWRELHSSPLWRKLARSGSGRYPRHRWPSQAVMDASSGCGPQKLDQTYRLPELRERTPLLWGTTGGYQNPCRTFAEVSYALLCTVMQFATDVTAKNNRNFNTTNQELVGHHVTVGRWSGGRAALTDSERRRSQCALVNREKKQPNQKNLFSQWVAAFILNCYTTARIVTHVCRHYR
jgi:hypothetical protein